MCSSTIRLSLLPLAACIWLAGVHHDAHADDAVEFAIESPAPASSEPAAGEYLVESKPGIRFVQRRAWRRSPEREYYKQMEEYYDDLEDLYDDRDKGLSKYFESLENYYEDLRKGRHVPYPPPVYHGSPSIVVGRPPLPDVRLQPQRRAPADGPQLAAPDNHPVAAPRGPDSWAALAESYQQLEGQLARLTTGEGWIRYLQLPDVVVHHPQEPEQPLADDDMQRLEQARERYRQVASNPEYQVIARRPAFAPTRQALESFVAWQQQLGGERRHSAPPPPEEIPLPEGNLTF